ncbi:unnamed protein product [Ceutorhynchus assimilis]|uniref:Uncharacterized protein n=1 Tax=Ceutorhynchus assimilis TaxID=467358 RepID=A0A9N9QRU0_9CUCU|nr:unnamed protein product [Ceutorhynchus assimilis]
MTSEEQNSSDKSITTTSIDSDEDSTFQSLFGISKTQFLEAARAMSDDEASGASNKRKSIFTSVSKKPFKCPHGPCNKTVSLSQYLTHFKVEHKKIKCYEIERNDVLLMPFNVASIINSCNICLAMIKLYEMNVTDVSPCGSSTGKVHTESFWLMVTGIPKKKSANCSYCVIWLFTSSEDSYNCTLELGTEDDSMTFSTFGKVANAFDRDCIDIAHIKDRIHSLVLTKKSLLNMLNTGLALNLQLTVH